MELLDVYDFTNPTRGIAVIINNENFQTNGTESDNDITTRVESRKGSSIDAVNLELTFGNLGFTVWRYDNLKASEMVETLEMMLFEKMSFGIMFPGSTKNFTMIQAVVMSKDLHLEEQTVIIVSANRSIHEKADCFVCAVLTHGCSSNLSVDDTPQGCENYYDILYGTDNDIVPITFLTKCFRDELCPGLTGKPKLFFIQACRGGEMDGGVDLTVSSPVNQDEGLYHCTTDAVLIEEELPHTDPPLVLYPPPLYKDFLLMYATPPGYTAWRSVHTGSWFIQDLCSQLTPENTCWQSLTTLLTRVSRQVSLTHRSSSTDEEQDGKKQVPCLTSMLTRDVFFLAKQLPVSDL